MMVGFSGTSYNGILYNYYSCNGKKKHICKRKNIQKDYIENVIVREVQEMLTDQLIETIATNVCKLAEKEKGHSFLKQLEKKAKEIEKQKNNLINSLKICDIDSVKHTIFEELAKIDNEKKEIETEIKIENSKHIDFNKTDIKFFLNQMKKLDTDIENNRKILINVLINMVYVYDDRLTIIFNVSKDKIKDIKLPTIEEINSSFLGNSSPPQFKQKAKLAGCLLRFLLS